MQTYTLKGFHPSQHAPTDMITDFGLLLEWECTWLCVILWTLCWQPSEALPPSWLCWSPSRLAMHYEPSSSKAVWFRVYTVLNQTLAGKHYWHATRNSYTTCFLWHTNLMYFLFNFVACVLAFQFLLSGAANTYTHKIKHIIKVMQREIHVLPHF